MGFSALHGKGVHEALLARQDAEIRLIETMRRCLSQKAKCDREYAISMVSVAQQGLKIDRVDEMSGSQIYQAWRKFMDELEQQSKQIRSNAEQLENLCSDRISQLYQDKRKSRKQYQEDHARIVSDFAHLTEDVARKKSEYQKHLDYYKQLRMRFEEHYIKSGRSGRKLDDVRDKYQKACRKLHLAHNEYVLLIQEATEVEKDYRTVLLPNLLEHQQTQQENFISTWKNLLIEATKFSDFTSDKYADIQKRIDCALQSVHQAEEYRDFTEKHISSPALPVIFRFDDALIEDSVGKLKSNQLAVDNLTVDWLRQRIIQLETTIKDCQEKQTKIQSTESNGKIFSPSSSLPTTPTLNNKSIISGSLNNSSSSMNSSKDSLKDTKISKDLNSLKCQERQISKLIEMIRTALNEVSCEELPSGCDDLSVEIDNNNIGNHDQLNHPNHKSMFIQKSGDFMTLLKTPFRMKRFTVAGDGKRSQSLTPKSERAVEGRSSSVVSMVNSFDEECDDDVVEAKTKNIYVDIDDNNQGFHVATNQFVDNPPPELPADNPIPRDRFKVIKVSTINEHEKYEECQEVDDGEFLSLPGMNVNCSKNNLLLYDEEIMSSFKDHFDNIDLINKNLDKLEENHQQIAKDAQDDENTSVETKDAKKIMKEKIPDALESTRKESFKSRVKNIFPKFERQSSNEDPTCDTKSKEKPKGAKGFLLSFKKKSLEKSSVDETDEIFEEISKVSSEDQQQCTYLDQADDHKRGKLASKFKIKLKLNLKSTKSMMSSKLTKTKTPSPDLICRRCSKRYSISESGARIHPCKAVFDFNKTFDTEGLFDDVYFCNCVDSDDDGDEFSDNGLCFKNKDVSPRNNLLRCMISMMTFTTL